MKRDIPLKDRVIVALDLESGEQARAMVRKCEPRASFFKVGLELFMADWFGTVDWIIDRGHQVMLDLKFFDIPETVKRAVARVSDRGISLATIHGNDAIIEAAVAERGGVKLLAVTVLTSFGEADLRAMGMTSSVADLVYHRASRALELGCDGVVSSGLEAPRLRAELGERLMIVTPGIRPGANTGAPEDDQQRIITAGRAIAGGADQVVVGRPITRSEDPLAVIEQMQIDIERALAAAEAGTS